MYKEKLTRREADNRSLLVEIRILKDKLEGWEQRHKLKIQELEFLIEKLKTDIESIRAEYTIQIEQQKVTIETRDVTIKELKDSIFIYMKEIETLKT